MNPKTDFGRKVRNYMDEFVPPLLTETDLSNALKEIFPEKTYYQPIISKYFTGEKDPPMDFVEKCATFFKLNDAQSFELLVLALRSSKEIRIDCSRMTMIPETISRLIALILSGKAQPLSDVECDKKIKDDKNFIDISYRQELRIPQLKLVIDGLVSSVIKKP